MQVGNLKKPFRRCSNSTNSWYSELKEMNGQSEKLDVHRATSQQCRTGLDTVMS
jgi:hypothetical protein